MLHLFVQIATLYLGYTYITFKYCCNSGGPNKRGRVATEEGET